MSMNSDAENYLQYYLDPKNTSDFAVMLDGPWGSGKTHFIKRFLNDRDAVAKRTDALAGPSYLYASLYGVQSPEQITDQFFAQVHPVLNSRVVRILGSAVSGAAKLFTGAQLSEKGDNSQVIKEIVLKLEGRVLVFDDLERCSMPISDAMGFINTFVEHDGLRVIVVANQEEISLIQRDEYKRRKEKLIGKTLRVRSDPSEVFDLFVKAMRIDTAKAAAITSKDAVLRTFGASDKQNLRSLRAVLTDYDRLVSLVDVRLQKAEEALSRLLLYMAATGFEFRAATLSAEELSSLTTWTGGLSLSNKKEEISKNRGLQSKYADVEWTNPIVPPGKLAHLYVTGIVEVTAINEYLAEHPLIVGYRDAPAWRQLWNWDDLPRAQYDTARAQLLNELNHHRLTHPGVILHAAGIVLGLGTFGDHIFGRNTNIISYFKKYLNKLLEDNRLEPAREPFEIGAGSYASLGYSNEDTEDFKRIKEVVKEATSAAFSKKMQDSAPILLKRLKDEGDTAYSSLHEYGVDKQNYADADLLHYIRTSDFADLLIVDSLPNGRLFTALNARYEHDAHNYRLLSEHEWWHTLHAELKERAKKAQPPYKKLLETRLSYYHQKIEQSFAEAKERSARHENN